MKLTNLFAMFRELSQHTLTCLQGNSKLCAVTTADGTLSLCNFVSHKDIRAIAV